MPNADPPTLTTWLIAFSESWHDVQLAAFGVITIQASGFVPAFSVAWSIGFATTEPTVPRSRCQELFTWQPLQFRPTAG